MAVHPAMETPSSTTELASPPDSDKQTSIQTIHWLNNRPCTGPCNACLEICLKGCSPVRVEECGHRWATITSCANIAFSLVGASLAGCNLQDVRVHGWWGAFVSVAFAPHLSVAYSGRNPSLVILLLFSVIPVQAHMPRPSLWSSSVLSQAVSSTGRPCLTLAAATRTPTSPTPMTWCGHLICAGSPFPAAVCWRCVVLEWCA